MSFLLILGELRGGEVLLCVRLLGVVRVRVTVSGMGVVWRVFGREVPLELPKKRKMPKAVKWLMGKLKVKKAEIYGKIGIEGDAARTAMAAGGLEAALCAGAAVMQAENVKADIMPVYGKNALEGKWRVKIGI